MHICYRDYRPKVSLPEFKLQPYARMRLLLFLHAERPAAAVKYGISVTFPHQDDRGGEGGVTS